MFDKMIVRGLLAAALATAMLAGTAMAQATITFLSGTNTISGPVLLAGNLDVDVVAGAVAIFSGNISETGGSRSLTSIDAGTLVLSGSDTYSGPTTANSGSLVINGWLTNSAVSIDSGASLSGTGSLTSATIFGGGILAPGDPLGALSLSGSLILDSGAVINYGLDTPSTSGMINAGSLTLSGQQFSDFNFAPTANFTPGSYTLIAAGSISGSLGTSVTGTVAGYPATLLVQGDDLVLSVPEPSTATLLGVGVLGLIGWAWRGGSGVRVTGYHDRFIWHEQSQMCHFDQIDAGSSTTTPGPNPTSRVKCETLNVNKCPTECTWQTATRRASCTCLPTTPIRTTLRYLGPNPVRTRRNRGRRRRVFAPIHPEPQRERRSAGIDLATRPKPCPPR